MRCSMIVCTFLVGLMMSLLGCGGGSTGNTSGGGGGSDAGTTGSLDGQSSTVTPNSIRAYKGNYASICESNEEITNLDQGGAVYAVTYSKVEPLSESVAAFTYRVDFYSDKDCTAFPIGSLENNGSNQVKIISAFQSGTEIIDRVQYDMTPLLGTFMSSPIKGNVLLPGAIRISIPDFLVFNYFTIKDVWRLKSNALWEGDEDKGVDQDGFPLTVVSKPFTNLIKAYPPAVPKPCAAKTVNWMVQGNLCSSQLGLTTSSANVFNLSNTQADTQGAASFVCTNGEWIGPDPLQATCATKILQNNPINFSCPEKTWSWTVNGHSCSGKSKSATVHSQDFITNDALGMVGSKSVQCIQSAPGVFSWTEFLSSMYPDVKIESCEVAKPISVITDPLKIVQVKACMSCHVVSGVEYTLPWAGGYAFPSFERISKYYAGRPPAAGVLEAKIRFGGVGVFGNVPMSGNSDLSDEELKIIIPWILSR
jgi:cytochrome c551/c552